jgi:hypothetical protein
VERCLPELSLCVDLDACEMSHDYANTRDIMLVDERDVPADNNEWENSTNRKHSSITTCKSLIAINVLAIVGEDSGSH